MAAEHPRALRELIDLWYAEAGKYKVLPIDGSMQQRLVVERPQTSQPRNRFVYYPNGSVIAPFACPPVFNRPFSIEADVEIPAGGAEGALLAQGGNAGGHILFVKDGRLRYTHNYVGLQELEVVATEPLTEGRHTLRYEFEPTGPPDLTAGKGSPGRAQLYVDGTLVGSAEFPVTTPFFFSSRG